MVEVEVDFPKKVFLSAKLGRLDSSDISYLARTPFYIQVHDVTKKVCACTGYIGLKIVNVFL